MCVLNVGIYGGVCVKLTGPQSRLTGKTSPPFNILNVTVPMVTSFQPPPVSLPSMFVLEGHLCLPQTVTFAWGFKQCWKPYNWLPFSKDGVKSNAPYSGCRLVQKNASAKACVTAVATLSTAQSLARSFLRHYFICGVLFTGIEQIPT